VGKRFSIKISKNRCKGCGLCIDVCSQKILRSSKLFNKFGYHFVEVCQDNCRGCKKCAIICPEAAIEIFFDEDQTQAKEEK